MSERRSDSSLRRRYGEFTIRGITRPPVSQISDSKDRLSNIRSLRSLSGFMKPWLRHGDTPPAKGHPAWHFAPFPETSRSASRIDRRTQIVHVILCLPEQRRQGLGNIRQTQLVGLANPLAIALQLTLFKAQVLL